MSENLVFGIVENAIMVTGSLTPIRNSLTLHCDHFDCGSEHI